MRERAVFERFWGHVGSRGDRGFRRGGFEEEGRGWRGGRGMRGGGRPFDHGELRFVILALIAEKPRHGYEIIKAIEEQFGGSYSPSPGVVYPTLTLLEEMGFATVAEQGGKKLYTITEEGQANLNANRATTEAAMGRMGEAAGRRRGPAPQLIRAMENLKLAVRLRYRSGPITEEQLNRIVAALDLAAQTIEQV